MHASVVKRVQNARMRMVCLSAKLNHVFDKAWFVKSVMLKKNKNKKKKEKQKNSVYTFSMIGVSRKENTNSEIQRKKKMMIMEYNREDNVRDDQQEEKGKSIFVIQ